MDSSPGAPEPGPPDGNEDEGPFFPWLPPEDRLWRHPSEATRSPSGPGFSDPTLEALARPAPADSGRSGWGRTATVAVIAGLVGALGASGVGAASGWWNRGTTIVRSVTSSSPTVSLAEAAGGPTNWAAVEEAVAASVVSVTVQGPSGPQQGSGLVILETDGSTAYVVTDRTLFASNEAVGYKGATTVTFLSGEEAKAKLIGDDSLSGVAVLRVADLGRDIPAAAGSVAELHEADPVLAVGARTLDGGSLSTGSVSGEDRTVNLNDGTDMDSLIAVTMPPMTSQATGGPLLDQYGRVVGVTVNVDPVETPDQQVTFAVPIDEVNRVATELINGQKVTHPWLGVSNSEDLPSLTAHQEGLTGGVEAGSVDSDGPAGRAGVQAHDIITSLAGKPMTSTGTMVSVLSGLEPGAKVPITYIHSGRTVQTTVVVAAEPSDAG